MEDLANEIYNVNVQALKKLYPKMNIEDLGRDNDMSAPSDKLIVEDCKNGQKTVKVNIDGKYKYAHSKYDPIKEAQKLNASVDIKRNSKIVVYGIGFAYHIEELAKHLGDENKIFVVEPNYDVFSALIRNRDISALLKNEKIKFLFGDADKVVMTLFSGLITWFDFDNIIYTNLPIYMDMYTDNYMVFVKAFRNSFSKIGVDRNTFMYFADKWQEIGFANLKYMIGSTNYMGFNNAFKDVPCVLVSAGPSLTKNVHLLKEIKGKFPILCVYTAYKVLKNNGIEPDFIISLDSGQTHLESEDAKKELIDVPLFCEGISDTDLLERHISHKMFIPESCSPLVCQLFLDLGKPYCDIMSGGSVACTALDLLVFMGAHPVILIGQDLAFTGRKAHADGTFYGNDDLQDEIKYMMVEDINGEDVPTNEVFLSFRVWFDYYIMDHSNKVDFIDATEGGAKILGTKIMTFRDAIDQNIHKSVDVEKIINEIFSNNPLFIDDEKNKFLERLSKMDDSFEVIEEILTKSVKICKKMIKIYENNEHKTKMGTIERCLSDLNDLDKKLDKQMSSFSAIKVLFNKVKEELENFDNDKIMSEELFIMNKNLLLYSRLNEYVERVKPIFSKTVKEFSNAINKQEE